MIYCIPVRSVPLVAWVALFTLVISGCGGGPDNLARVKGRVTLDGQPLAGAVVVFSSLAIGGSSAADKTDDDGYYELSYARGVSGAEIGEYTIYISTFSHGAPDSDPPEPAVAERVPAKYNVQTELRRTVEAGQNTLDLDLTSSGPIAAMR